MKKVGREVEVCWRFWGREGVVMVCFKVSMLILIPKNDKFCYWI